VRNRKNDGEFKIFKNKNKIGEGEEQQGRGRGGVREGEIFKKNMKRERNSESEGEL
jgi:hypothetical protein